MQGQINPKIVGATLLGFALIGAAYTFKSLTTPKTTAQPAAIAATAPARVAIAVVDEDNNGIEDWRDDFVTTKPVILNQISSSTYEQPTTLTGMMSINFLEDVIRAKNYGPFGKTEDEVINHTVQNLVEETSVELYTKSDIDVMETWENEDIRNYANTLAVIITTHNVAGLEGEITTLKSILESGETTRINDLKQIANAYMNFRDDTLKIPVPAFLSKQHLDLINTYNVVYEDVTAMTQALDDPVLTLLHLKRYQEDVSGLGYALQNMYFGLEPYSHLAEPDDPAVMFVFFSPDFQN